VDRRAPLGGAIRGDRSDVTTKGRLLACDLVVAGIGITPDSELLAAAGAAVDGGVLVDEHCRTLAAGRVCGG